MVATITLAIHGRLQADERQVHAGEKSGVVTGFKISVPTDWIQVNKSSEFVEDDGYVSPRFFDLYGKHMPIVASARRFKLEKGQTTEDVERLTRKLVSESVEQAKKDIAADGYAGPNVSLLELQGCVVEIRKYEGTSMIISTMVETNGGDDKSLVTKYTAVSYISGDSRYVFLIGGLIQIYRDYEKEILSIVKSLKPKKDNKTSLLTPDPPSVPAILTATTSTRSRSLAPGQA